MNTELATTTTTTNTIAATADNAAVVYLASLGSDNSRRAMYAALARMAGYLGYADVVECPWGELRSAHTAALRSRLQADGLSAQTVNQALAALRGTLKAAWRLGQMTSDDYARAADVQSVRAVAAPQATGRAVTYGEIMAIAAAAADGTAVGTRDSALLALAYACGLRREEIASIKLADYDAGTGRLLVTGKGAKRREVYVTNGAKRALDTWLALRSAVGGDTVFVSLRRGGHLTPEAMSAQAVYKTVTERCAAAGVTDVTPHDFRRTYAGELLDAGADLATVQQLMGHSSPTTTAGYDRRDSRARQAASSKLHWPGK